MLMPSSSGSSFLGPRGDLGYAIFVGVVLLLSLVAAVIFYRRAPPRS